MAAVDSAASGNYFPATYRGEAHDSETTSIPVGTANDEVMRSVATDRFPLAGVPAGARRCYKFRQVSLPLVSVGKLCVHGMKVHFDEHHVKVYNQANKLLLVGHRDPLRNLYMIPIEDSQEKENAPEPRVGPKKQSSVNSMRIIAPGIPRSLSVTKSPDPSELVQTAASAYEIRNVPALISYLHATAGWIPKETLLDGINNNFYRSWPGLTAPRVQRHLKKQEITVFGHQKLVRKGIRPRKKKRRSKIHDVGVALFDPKDDDDMKNLIAMDLPGRFPTTSASGNKYIFVMVDYDSDFFSF